MTPGFTHLEQGTSEQTWQADPRLLSRPALAPDIDRVIVVAAHPDDETLGAAGLMARVHASGGTVTVIVASDGEASHPHSRTHSPVRLAGLRRLEVTRAVHAVAPGAGLHFLGLPDGALREHADELAARLAPHLDDAGDAALVVAPWSGDGHRDHRIIAEAVAAASARSGVRHLGYPIWLWHWGDVADVPWERAVCVALTTRQRAAKREALQAHESQVNALSGDVGDEPVIHAGMLAHFDRPVELFFEEDHPRAATLPAEWFDAFYARNRDPWGFDTRWYEQRKREILLASLPDEHLGSVLEIGCSTGHITARLVQRARIVVAMDAAQAAIDRARERLRGQDRVSFIHGSAPADLPSGPFDTVVLSEVGYYLSREHLAQLIESVAAAMSEDGCLVACHWRHSVADYPLGGDDVHRALRAHPGWEAIVRHEERDFILEVFTPSPARSVAEREGLQ